MITYDVSTSLIMTHTIFKQWHLNRVLEENGIDNPNIDWVVNDLEVIGNCDSGIINIPTLIQELMLLVSMGVSGIITLIDDHHNHTAFKLQNGAILPLAGRVVYEISGDIINIR